MTFASTEEIQLTSRAADGTLGKPVTIWVVAVDGSLYVRAYRGREAAWFRQALSRTQGRITAGRVAQDVTFSVPPESVQLAVDAAFLAKYRGYGAYVDSMLSAPARAATLQLVPLV